MGKFSFIKITEVLAGILIKHIPENMPNNHSFSRFKLIREESRYSEYESSCRVKLNCMSEKYDESIELALAAFDIFDGLEFEDEQAKYKVEILSDSEDLADTVAMQILNLSIIATPKRKAE